MDKIINEIRMTDEYDKFKVFTFNRTINEKHVKKLMKRMSQHGWKRGNYVIVDENSIKNAKLKID